MRLRQQRREKNIFKTIMVPKPNLLCAGFIVSVKRSNRCRLAWKKVKARSYTISGWVTLAGTNDHNFSCYMTTERGCGDWSNCLVLQLALTCFSTLCIHSRLLISLKILLSSNVLLVWDFDFDFLLFFEEGYVLLLQMITAAPTYTSKLTLFNFNPKMCHIWVIA